MADDVWSQLLRRLVVGAVMGAATIAVDLLESLDVRARRAGADLFVTVR